MAMAFVAPSQLQLGTISGRRQLESVQDDFRTRIEINAALLSQKLRRQKQREEFKEDLAYWMWSVEVWMFHNFSQWALKYAPEQQPFGLTTNFTQQAFGDMDKVCHRLNSDHVDTLGEMLWALQIWVAEEGFEVERASWQELGGADGIAMLLRILRTGGGGRAHQDEIMKRRRAWYGVILASMDARDVESLAPVVVWKNKIMGEVVAPWMEQIQEEDRRVQWGFVAQFLDSNDF